MIPEGRLSTTPFPGQFIWPEKQREKPLVGYHIGGVNISDPSAGLEVKLWTVSYNKDTNGVEVSAPGSVTTTLFTAADVEELDIAFDQNMRPIVVYVQAGAAKFYWYDPTIENYTHTNLPAGSKNPRVCMDDTRYQFTSSLSTVIIAYMRAESLMVKYQTDRYTAEHMLQEDCGGTLVNIGMNHVWRLQFYIWGATDGAVVASSPFLADVVKDLCLKSGIPSEAIDVSELYNDRVAGLKVSADIGLDTPIDELRKVFFFDKSDFEGQIHFPKRGRDVTARIPYSDLVRGNPESLKKKYVDETQLAREVNISHLDPDGGFARNKQFAIRRSNRVNTQRKRNNDTGVVLTVDQAATAAEVLLRIEWNEQISYEFSTTIKWTDITTADVIEVEDRDGSWHRMRIEERNEDGTIQWKGKQDAGTRTYAPQRTGNSLPTPISTTPGIIGPTRLEIINVSPQRDQDDELGLYVAACGESSAWTGYTLYYSTDGGLSYTEAYTANVPSIIGETTTDLLDDTSYEYHGEQTVDVLSNFALASINDDQLLARQNRIIIGDEELQFKTATLLGMVGSLFNYRLSTLVRGRFATEVEPWPAGTRFVVLDESVIFVQLQRTFLGQDITYKAVSLGQSNDEAIPLDYLFDVAYSQTEWLPVSLTAARDGSDNVTVNWIGRARLGTDSHPYHSKYFRGYRVKFSDGHIIDTTDVTATYTSAPVGATVQVCGLNEITGEGPFTAALAT